MPPPGGDLSQSLTLHHLTKSSLGGKQKPQTKGTQQSSLQKRQKKVTTLLSVPTAVVTKMSLLHLSDFWFKPCNRFTSDLGYLHFIY